MFGKRGFFLDLTKLNLEYKIKIRIFSILKITKLGRQIFLKIKNQIQID